MVGHELTQSTVPNSSDESVRLLQICNDISELVSGTNYPKLAGAMKKRGFDSEAQGEYDPERHLKEIASFYRALFAKACRDDPTLYELVRDPDALIEKMEADEASIVLNSVTSPPNPLRIRNGAGAIALKLSSEVLGMTGDADHRYNWQFYMFEASRRRVLRSQCPVLAGLCLTGLGLSIVNPEYTIVPMALALPIVAPALHWLFFADSPFVRRTYQRFVAEAEQSELVQKLRIIYGKKNDKKRYDKGADHHE